MGATGRAFRGTLHNPFDEARGESIQPRVRTRVIATQPRTVLVTVRGVQIIGLDHVQVAAPVGSESDARRFYGGVLGLSELEKPEALEDRGGVWFACGAQQLHVGVTPDFSPALKAHPALRVRRADLDLIAEQLIAAGSVVHWDEAIPDTPRFYTADPWGNRIELIGATRA